MFYDRRAARGSRRIPGGKKTLFQRVLALSAGLPLFLASGHITLSGTGDILSFHDANDDAHVLTQSDTAKQVDPPAAHADFANQLCVTRNPTDAFYESNRTPAYWGPWHQGTGRELWAVWTPVTSTTGFHFHTTNGFTGPGFGLGTSGSNVIYQVKKPPDSVNRSVGKSNSIPVYSRCTYLEGASPEAILQVSGSAAATQASAETPDAANPQRALRWGWSGAATGERLAAIPCFPRLDATGLALVQQWVQQAYGIPP